jgi:predicted RNA-binding Zn-ribbon protein involved in translation (DUF1610 family)
MPETEVCIQCGDMVVLDELEGFERDQMESTHLCPQCAEDMYEMEEDY